MTQTTTRKKKTLSTTAFLIILLLWFSAIAYDEFSTHSLTDHESIVVGNTGFIESSAEQISTVNSTGTVSDENVTTVIFGTSNQTNVGNSTIAENIVTNLDGNTTSVGENSNQTMTSNNSTSSDLREIEQNSFEESDSYVFEFLRPLGKARFSVGSTIPVKFTLTDSAGNYITTMTAKIMVDSVPATSRGAANSENLFRLSDDLYIFNLNTAGMSTGSHTISVEPDSGSTYSITIELV